MKKEPRIYFSDFDTCIVDLNLDNFWHDPYNHPKVKLFRQKYRLNSIIKGKKNDFKSALAIAEWVSSRWIHQGIPGRLKSWDSLTILEEVSKGKSFSCVEFGIVFVQVCHALGIPARLISVTTKRPDLGDSGSGHVTAEYWDNQLQKWVWIDPQICAYAIIDSKPVSYFELHTNRKASVKFTKRTKKYLVEKKSSEKILMSFLKRYNGSISYGSRKETQFLFSKPNEKKFTLLLKGIPYCTFQGFPYNGGLFVGYDSFYKSINQLQVEVIPKPLISQPQFKDLKDYQTNRKRYFAKSNITLKFHHSIPWLDKFCITINGKTHSTKLDNFKISLNQGINKLIVTPINLAGRETKSTKLTINWDNKYPNVKSYW